VNKEYSAGAIIFRKNEKEPLFLLIYSERNKIWGFPKGHIEPGESEKDTLIREVQEETGLSDLSFIEAFREEDIYECVSNRLPYKGQRIEKHSIYYLCETNTPKITIDEEEIGDYRWLKAEEITELLPHEGTNEIFKEAYKQKVKK